MIGSLVLIEETTISSGTSSVTLGGNNWDNSYDVYVLLIKNLTASASNTIDIQFLVSNSADTSSNYDSAAKNLYDAGSYANNSGSGGSDIPFGNTIGTGTQHQSNAILYLYNFNSASEYSYITYEETAYNGSSVGRQGAGVLKVAQATNGVLIKAGTDNINSGSFKLYGIKN
mgnify:FL=1|tara:strand:- start:19 stop:534 length:516 start_codon:yes stop_codon:yes gene_type:complete